MRPFIIAGAVSVGLVALWLAMLPLTAKPTRPAAASQAMAETLVACRSPNGLDQLCVGALAKALVRDTARLHIRSSAFLHWPTVRIA